MSTNAYGESKKTEGFRRNWDNEAYAKKARDREQQNRLADEDEERRRKGLKPRTRGARPTEARELLQSRKQAVDLEGMVGKVQIVQASTAASGQPGFYCKVCDVTVKDSLSYLDHINGKNHQRVLNRSMKVASETVADVLAKLQSLRELKRRQQQQTKDEYSFQEQVNQQQQAERQKRDKRREARRRQRQAKARGVGSKSPSPDADADDMGSAMGFASFGSTKK
ncbi:U4/U6.U5 snRNP associated protein [Coemansia aciculifera]|uniref:U4/U6.U5 snRNP associated protein n=2 Tax=Coemansia TaxID=4863 RepID=A0A9W8LE31_9FUNG|nr:U4/U6.U5 snRNP associated protein [Coemansia pectinata]KAJ2865563.1 U4/U6.U5 snRNP associated protein [Coemansia aciculifera]KAJ2875098.1 U4/U6.U5 snRNP associated protein [Coemansia aciculifera]